MEAIILAGGKGTRLKSVIDDIPKPMAPIGKKPFLSFILDQLAAQDFKRVILSTGYKHEVVEQQYQKSYRGLEIRYSREQEPLGTGGAIRKALSLTESKQVFIFNGDTLFEVDLKDMHNYHNSMNADMTIALKKMDDCSRYGTVETENGRITRFREKKANQLGAINGGIYLFSQKVLKAVKEMPEIFSFEQDFMQVKYKDLKMMGYISDAFFIDIGIPADYQKAQNHLMSYDQA